ncbi:dynein light intermediate chain-domain-containing protein [Roridomyces roridus]|uniref:Dynein light intermediate chain-domain-containing protein n=1 Tax=Roridomyces roridus TaxID=1738132 RepID=A0AAD7C5K8_9AGAR|nr:dynein light intermediate chain-domain-containing protein [Roridomyces roridus]
MDSRPASPEAPPQDLWGSILDSVSSSRSIPSKQILLLGQPSTGKSTLMAGLLQKPPADEKDDHRTDFAVGYDFANVRDEADEDTIARLSVYTVPSSSPEYTSLLPHFVPPRTALPHTLVMIALDWTRPWTFVEELETWLQWVEGWARGDTARELEIVREESRERLQAHLQHYSEPSTDPVATASSVSGSTLLPLGPGTFTHNSAGVPIVVVCTKADLIDEGSDLGASASGMGGMVRGKGGEWEERTDGVMQVLRTICLKYGAGLFYTTQHQATLQTLRQYALHMLFIPPAPSPAVASGAEAPAPVRNPFPFTQKPNYLDRDRIVVPAGWDSWGKITIMREEFEARSWADAWDRDFEAEDVLPSDGAQAMFSALVPDQGIKPPPLPPLNNPVPEQVFLSKNYDENAKKPDRDPRGAFRDPTDSSRAAGLVGPLGIPSFDLPTVDRVLSEMEIGIGGSGGTSAPPPRAAAPASRRPAGLAALTNSPRPAGGSGGSPIPAAVPSPTSASGDNQTQHEVLKKFFDRLLTKDRAGATATVKDSSSSNGNGNGNGNGGGSGAEEAGS